MGIFSGLLKEQRAYPPKVLSDWFGWGKKTTSGINVSESTALTYTAFWSAVDGISRAIAYLPLHVYRKTGKGRERADEHAIYKLLHDRPNQEMTSFIFRQTMQSWILIYGNAYADIQRDKANRPLAFHPIHPRHVEIIRKGDEIWYIQKDERGVKVAEIPSWNMLHPHGLGDGLYGWSPVKLFRETIGLGLAAEKYGSAFFGNGASPGGILEHPAQLSDDALKHLNDSWNSEHGGPGNASKPAILEEGMVWKSVGMPNDDAQFLETRQFGISDIARIFHMPPHKLADLTRATFSNIEHQAIEYVQDCLAPWLSVWEQEINTKLFGAPAQGPLYAEFLVEALLRGDSASRADFYGKMFNIGALSPNDIRRLENMDPVPDGDIYLVPVNLQSVERAGKEPAPAPAPPPVPPVPPPSDKPPDDDAARAVVNANRGLLVDLCSRIVRKEVNALRKASRRFGMFAQEVEKFIDGHDDHIREVLGSAVVAGCQAMRSTVDPAKVVAEFAHKHIETLTKTMGRCRRDGLLMSLLFWETDRPQKMAEELMQELTND